MLAVDVHGQSCLQAAALLHVSVDGLAKIRRRAYAKIANDMRGVSEKPCPIRTRLPLFFFPCYQRPPFIRGHGAGFSIRPAETPLHRAFDLTEAGGNSGGALLRRLHAKVGGVLSGPVRQIGHNNRFTVRRAQMPDFGVSILRPTLALRQCKRGLRAAGQIAGSFRCRSGVPLGGGAPLVVPPLVLLAAPCGGAGRGAGALVVGRRRVKFRTADHTLPNHISLRMSTSSASAMAIRFLAVRFPASASPSSTRWIWRMLTPDAFASCACVSPALSR